ncbi:MAG: hypothetical protein ACKOPS_18480, partial [Cyanobium sp.]
AGKSNLLEAMLLLARLVGERTLTEAFAEGIRGYPLEAFSLPPEGMEALLLQPRPTIRLEAEMSEPKIPGSMKKPSILSYQIAVGIDPQSGRLSVLDERLEDLHRNRRSRSKNPCLEKVSREKDGENVELLAIRKRGSQSPPFEEAIGLHHTIVSNRQYTGPERYPLFDQLHREIGAWRMAHSLSRPPGNAPAPATP